MQENWFSIRALAGGAQEIAIHDEIGAYGVTAKDFIRALQAIYATEIDLSINSPGGAVFEAFAIYNALRQHSAHVTVRIMGVAASAASLIAMAGDRIVMPMNAFMMVHNPRSLIMGEAEELRAHADALDKISASFVATYAGRTRQPEERIREMLAAETWLDAEEAVALGFADEIAAEVRIAANFDTAYMPPRVRAQLSTTPIIGAADVKRVRDASAAAGLGDFADVWLFDANLATVDQALAAIAEAKEIRDLCDFAKVPDQAADFIRARASMAEVRRTIINARAAASDALEVCGYIPAESSRPVSLNDQVWAARGKGR